MYSWLPAIVITKVIHNKMYLKITFIFERSLVSIVEINSYYYLCRYFGDIFKVFFCTKFPFHDLFSPWNFLSEFYTFVSRKHLKGQYPDLQFQHTVHFTNLGQSIPNPSK